jgi:hypothetical protein
MMKHVEEVKWILLMQLLHCITIMLKVTSFTKRYNPNTEAQVLVGSPCLFLVPGPSKVMNKCFGKVPSSRVGVRT